MLYTTLLYYNEHLLRLSYVQLQPLGMANDNDNFNNHIAFYSKDNCMVSFFRDFDKRNYYNISL